MFLNSIEQVEIDFDEFQCPKDVQWLDFDVWLTEIAYESRLLSGRENLILQSNSHHSSLKVSP